MRFDRTSESYRARALTAERYANRHSLAGDRRMAQAWRRVAEEMRATALTLAMAPRPAVEMAVSL